jgi:cytochrome c biogenesis protein CcdA
MTDLVLGLGSALWLGILTSISPCPLATNIAAISFIGGRVESPGRVFLAGSLYTLGRTVVYLILSVLIVGSLVSSPQLSAFLQKYMNKILGPVLIVAGMFLMELLWVNFHGPGSSQALQKRAQAWGVWGSVLLGMIFALSFCPVSAALFFGSLIPLALKYNSNLLLPLGYGLGTALPVFVFAILIAVGTRSVGRAFQKVTVIEYWARRITGGLFIAVGIYLSLRYIFDVI